MNNRKRFISIMCLILVVVLVLGLVSGALMTILG